MIRAIALGLPDAFERPSYGGQPAWRTPRRMFAWVRTDPDALVVWVADLDEKEGLLATQGDLLFTTPHYDGYPMLLARLDVLSRDRAEELVRESYRVRTGRPAGS